MQTIRIRRQVRSSLNQEIPDYYPGFRLLSYPNTTSQCSPMGCRVWLLDACCVVLRQAQAPLHVRHFPYCCLYRRFRYSHLCARQSQPTVRGALPSSDGGLHRYASHRMLVQHELGWPPPSSCGKCMAGWFW